MDDFRHNLSPVEVKIFLKTVAPLAENLLIRYCVKTTVKCPKCGARKFCQSGAVSLFSSSFDKITHEMKACLQCGYQEISPVITVEKM